VHTVALIWTGGLTVVYGVALVTEPKVRFRLLYLASLALSGATCAHVAGWL
jgi:hypothetical protein